MGGILLCSKCDVRWHSHDGTGSYINDEHYCENCTGELEYLAELKYEIWMEEANEDKI